MSTHLLFFIYDFTSEDVKLQQSFLQYLQQRIEKKWNMNVASPSSSSNSSSSSSMSSSMMEASSPSSEKKQDSSSIFFICIGKCSSTLIQRLKTFFYQSRVFESHPRQPGEGEDDFKPLRLSIERETISICSGTWFLPGPRCAWKCFQCAHSWELFCRALCWFSCCCDWISKKDMYRAASLQENLESGSTLVVMTGSPSYEMTQIQRMDQQSFYSVNLGSKPGMLELAWKQTWHDEFFEFKECIE